MNLRWKIAQAAEIRWWRRYLGSKDPVAYAAWKSAYWKNFLEKTGVVIDGKDKILDAGCGPSGIFMIFQSNFVDAVDPLLEQYEQSLPGFKKANFPNTRFYTLPLEQFDSSESYNVVFCLNAINHVDDLDKSFDALVGSVKKGGTLVVSIDAHHSDFLKKIFQAVPGDILHPHQYGLEEYRQMLIQRGCRMERTILFKKEFIFSYYVLVAQRI